MSASQVVLIILGAGLFVAAARIMWFWRWNADGDPAPNVRRDPHKRPRVERPSPLGRVSEPTRLSIGIVALVIGYHCVVWGLPPSIQSLKFPADRWYVLVGVGALWAGLSVVMDRWQDRPSDGPP